MGEWLPTIQEARDSFLADLELAGRAAGTRRAYAMRLRPLPDGPIIDVTPDVCRALILHDLRQHAPATAALTHAALSAFCRYCKDRGWVAVSPMRDIPCPHVPPKAHRYLTPDECARLWAACQSDEMRAALLFL